MTDENEKPRGLRVMQARDFMAAPVVYGRLKPGRECWLFEVTCPFCGQGHQHGAGEDGSDLGPRLSHCVGQRPQVYILALSSETSTREIIS